MLLGDLFTYNIIEKAEGELKAEISINKDHHIFEGHFPGVPVLPGVCQVQAIKEILQEVTGFKLQISKVRDIKFMSMVDPTQTEKLQCVITYSDSEEALKTNALLSYNETTVLKLRGNLSKV